MQLNKCPNEPDLAVFGMRASKDYTLAAHAPKSYSYLITVAKAFSVFMLWAKKQRKKMRLIEKNWL
ncbi:MAG: hypothetical protein JWP58_1844 [Hymenobacter sp.]|nr:hypothetical protein [Hymenobacter sp.]